MSKVLIIDDSHLMVEIAKKILIKTGHEVLSASDGLSGIEAAKKEKPQIILLDIVMPDIDGYETCTRLKNDQETKDISIIMLSSKSEHTDKVKGLHSGSVDYITKPFNEDELIARVNIQAQLQELHKMLQDKNRELEELSFKDGLTGLYNYRFFQNQLILEMEKSKRYGDPMACMILDIDHFKRVNDTYGHLAGDAVLTEMGKLLKDVIRTSDIPARYGGEEFAVILLRNDKTNALVCVERLRKRVEETDFKFKEAHLKITVSIGVAVYPGEGISAPTDLVEKADKALYIAKENGRNRIEML